MKTKLPIITSIVIGIIVVACLVLTFKSDLNVDYIGVATLVLLVGTFIGLVVYANDTHRMTKIQEDRWEAETIPVLYYGIELRNSQDHSYWFLLTNPSPKYFIEVWVNLNLKVCGEAVEYSDAYNGKDKWFLFPNQISKGWFSIDGILGKKGKTFSKIKEERTNDNVREQLTMDLEDRLRCRETGKSRNIPRRRHYFDFKEEDWVPELIVKE